MTYDHTHIPHWLVDGKKYFNQWSALQAIYAPGPRQDFRFVAFEDQYDSIDWTIEPKESFEDLCLDQARYLRDKYDKVKLFFTAGRDSGHIFRVFKENNIRIDELILVKYMNPLRIYEHDKLVYPKALELTRDLPDTKVTEWIMTTEDYQEFFGDEYFFEKDFISLQNGIFQNSHYHLTTQKFDKDIGSNVCYVHGLEKPKLVIEDGNWYFRTLDLLLNNHNTNIDGMEYFYYAPNNPKLMLKQCWMLIKHIEQNHAGWTIEQIHKFANTSQHDRYDELCRALGRGPAMIWEVGNGYNKILDNNDPYIKKVIEHSEKEGWSTYKNFKRVMNDLQRNWAVAMKSNNVEAGTIGVWGKKYFIKKHEKGVIYA